jgi:hypothetical protein
VTLVGVGREVCPFERASRLAADRLAGFFGPGIGPGPFGERFRSEMTNVTGGVPS